MAEQQKSGFLVRVVTGLIVTLVCAYALAFLADLTHYESQAFYSKALTTMTEQYHRSKGD